MDEHPFVKILLGYMGPRYGAGTKANCVSQAKAFLTRVGTKGKYSSLDITNYVSYLTTTGHKATSVQAILGHIRLLFRANKIEWPADKRDVYIGLTDHDPITPVLPITDIAKMIEGAKGARFPDLQITLLSTMWGLRKTEIATVLSAGLDGKTLEVQTAKHGRQRVHPIPPQLSLPLSFRGKHETANAMGPAFQRIMRRYVREPEPREGWHAIRRSLVTELFHNGAPEIIIFKFMGWRRNDMTYTYFKPSATEIMDAILPKHPFFPLWLS